VVAVSLKKAIRGIVGDTINVEVAFWARSPFASVNEMRVRVGGMPYSEREMAEVAWGSFVSLRQFPFEVPLGSVDFYVSVQYRDTRGHISPVYFDYISIGGMSPTPTAYP
jgi:hypothetical protein